MDEVYGVFVDYVNPNSAARDAGLQSGDVIISLNGTATGTFPELQEMIARNRPGDELSIVYLRKGIKHSSTVILQQKVIRKLDPMMVEIGFELKDLNETEVAKFGKAGAKVNSIYRDSKIEETNMELDFIITSVNGAKVTNVNETLQTIKDANVEVVELGGFYPQFEGEYFYAFSITGPE
ncbi:MAG: PDZ domain-containing protein [Saprospiraceae bacterium]|nr:PDZ domain-containing protein [Saprospiraceae bacterium]